MNGTRTAARPIGDYALLSDCQSAALVSSDGAVEWLCLPRFDAPSVFASLLDPVGGHWVIRPRGEFDCVRRYADRSLVLETTFWTPAGRAVLTDALVLGEGERGTISASAPRTCWSALSSSSRASSTSRRSSSPGPATPRASPRSPRSPEA